MVAGVKLHKTPHMAKQGHVHMSGCRQQRSVSKCAENTITTNFVRKGPKPNDEPSKISSEAASLCTNIIFLNQFDL